MAEQPVKTPEKARLDELRAALADADWLTKEERMRLRQEIEALEKALAAESNGA